MRRVFVNFSTRFRNRLAAFSLAGALLLVAEGGGGLRGGDEAAAPDAGKEGAPQPSGLVERAEARLNLLEVVVLDRKGRHVRALPRSAFHVFEKKQELPIESLDEVDVAPPREPRAPIPEGTQTKSRESADGGAALNPAAAVPDASGGVSTAPATAQGPFAARLARPRWLLLLFDGYNNPSALRMSELRRVAKRWVAENLRPEDFAAVYDMTPYPSAICGFTRSVGDLRRAIDEVRVFPGGDVRGDVVRESLRNGDTQDRQVVQQRLKNASTFGNDLLGAERDTFYSSMADVSNVFAGADGARAILLFSGGFPITRSRGSEARGGLTPRFKNMLEAFERQSIRVFTFDVGEEGGFSDASQAGNMSQMLDQLGFGQEWLQTLQMGLNSDGAHAHQEILAILGNETGGRFIRGRDFEAGLEAASDDLGHYYLLGYSPSDLTLTDRGYAPLRVEIDGEGNRAVTRRGRFLDSSLAVTPVTPPAEATPRRPASDAKSRDAGNAPLSLVSRPLFYPMPDGRTLVVLAVRVAGPVPFVPASAGSGVEIDLEIRVSATLSSNDVRRSGRNVRARLKPEARAALTRGLEVREAIVLPAQTADLAVFVRFNGLDRSGNWSGLVEVPARPTNRFGLTDLALFAPADAVPVVFDVFRAGETISGTVPPSPLEDPLGAWAGARPAGYFGGPMVRGLPLVACVGVVEPPRAVSGEPSPLRMDWELLSDAGGAPIAPPIRYRRLEPSKNSRMLEVVADIDLGSVPAGAYTLRLTAENLRTHVSDSRRVAVQVAP